MDSKMKWVILILVTVLFIILFIIINKSNQNNYNENNIINNNLSNTTNQVNETNVTNSTNTSSITKNENTNTENTENSLEENKDEEETEEYCLVRVDTISIYFLAKYCIENYYDNTTMNAKNCLIDQEALSYYSSSLFDWVDKNNYYSVSFVIDKLYAQSLSDNMFLMLVYYRYTSDNETCNDTSILIRVDTSNSTYSIYPDEYIEQNNYTKLKGGDRIALNNIKTIKSNTYNQFDMDEIDVTAETYALELFEKLKFDMLVDNEHLYDMLDDDYKELKFPTLQDFENYIEENRETIMYEKLVKYRFTDEDDYVQVAGITSNDRYIYFEVDDLSDYTVYLDNYTIVQINTYDDAVLTWKSSYCLQRVFSAIDEKDYSFVYEHLSVVQKNNYFKTEEEFIEYMENLFYDNNIFEIDDDYLIVTDEIYQYTVYVTNEGEPNQTKTVTVTVEVKDETDFEVAIN